MAKRGAAMPFRIPDATVRNGMVPARRHFAVLPRPVVSSPATAPR